MTNGGLFLNSPDCSIPAAFPRQTICQGTVLYIYMPYGNGNERVNPHSIKPYKPNWITTHLHAYGSTTVNRHNSNTWDTPWMMRVLFFVGVFCRLSLADSERCLMAVSATDCDVCGDGGMPRLCCLVSVQRISIFQIQVFKFSFDCWNKT